jgi:hypothetical protein
MDLPDPLRPLINALGAILSPCKQAVACLICLHKKCIYAPYCVASRVITKHGFVVNYYTYCCARCGKPQTVTSSKHAKFRRRANISWDHYEPPRPKVMHCVPPLHTSDGQ